MRDADSFRRIQKQIAEEGLDGWLLYDFRGMNPLVSTVLPLPEDIHLTRRYFFWIPAQGTPRVIVSAIEAGNWRTILRLLPGDGKSVDLHLYTGRETLEGTLKEILKPGSRVAMEYSPMGAVPAVSRVDAGTIEMIRSFGADIASSADLLQQFLTLSDKQLTSHRNAVSAMLAARDAGFGFIHEHLQQGKEVDELSVQTEIMRVLQQRGIVTDHPAIVGFGAHAADPHFAPNAEDNALLQPGQCVLLDIWGQEPGMPFADITWMGCAGTPGSELQGVWEAVRDARDAAVSLIQTSGYNTLQGWQPDREARNLLIGRGFGEAFLHRLGHNIHLVGHGPGVNLDDLESHDTRRLREGLLCSIEPGVYLPERGIGVRSEINIYFAPGGEAEVTTPEQREPIILGKAHQTITDALQNAL